MEDNDPLTGRIIGAAIEVHRVLGPGLLEPVYERALCIEFDLRRLKYESQVRLPALYKGRSVGNYCVDLVVAVVVEVKSVIAVAPVFEAQLITYMKLTKKRRGLILNFHSPALKDGITRRVL
jgi:GxxExxY protein